MWSNAARSILSDAISRGRPPLEATLYAGDQAMADYIAGKIPLTKLLRGVKVSSPFFKTVIGQFVLDSGSDQFARHWQDFNSWAVLHPERTFEVCLKERPMPPWRLRRHCQGHRPGRRGPMLAISRRRGYESAFVGLGWASWMRMAGWLGRAPIPRTT